MIKLSKILEQEVLATLKPTLTLFKKNIKHNFMYTYTNICRKHWISLKNTTIYNSIEDLDQKLTLINNKYFVKKKYNKGLYISILISSFMYTFIVIFYVLRQYLHLSTPVSFHYTIYQYQIP